MSLGSGCTSVPHLRGELSGALTASRRLAVDLEVVADAGGVLIHHDRLKHPVYVHRHDDPSDSDEGAAYTAVLTTCTHRGCQAEPTGTRIVCPCHGSQFEVDGTLLDGPADRALRRFPVRTDDETLYVHIQTTEDSQHAE